MATITAGGLGSGIDVDLLVETLTAAEERPVKARLDFREIQIQAEVTAFSTLKDSLSSFQSALSGLTSEKQFSSRSATSSDDSIFTATASNGAAPSSMDIEVLSLASGQKSISGDFAGPDTAVGAGDLTIDVGAESFTVTIEGGVNNTLIGIRDAINDAEDNKGVSASILTVDDPMTPGQTVSKLILTSQVTGSSNGFSISVTNDGDGDDFDDSGLSSFIDANLTTTAATDAQIKVDGFTATSSTNNFTGVIAGVTVTVVSADPGNTHTLGVISDVSKVTEKITEFVDAFNSFNTTYRFLTAVDIEANESGLLTGDSTARSIDTQIRRILNSLVGEASDTFTSLARIGITVGKEGELKLDTTVLATALDEEFDEVANLIAGDGGIGKQLDNFLKETLKSDGLIPSREKTFKAQLIDISEQRIALADRIASVEERIRRQFANMDILVAQFKSTGNFIQQQFDAINGIRPD